MNKLTICNVGFCLLCLLSFVSVDRRLPNGNYWFNAVMLRGYEELYKVDRNKAWIDFYEQDADAIWNHERDSNNMLGPNTSKKLLDQAAMIEIYARLQQLKTLH